MENLSLVTLNANGLRSMLKRRALFNDLRKSKSEIIFLQETHSTAKDEQVWLTEWGGPGYFSHGRSNARGVGILFQRGFNPKLEETYADEEGRSLILQFKMGEQRITLANLYAPTQSEPREQDQFLSSIDEILGRMEIHTLFLGGDFNAQLDGHGKDPVRRSTHLTSYVEKIKSLMDDYSLEDVWGCKNPKSTRGTFHRGAYSARLDYWFIPALILPHASIQIRPHPLSDHCLLTLKISFAEVKRGPGYWRFDNSLLADADFVNEMKTHIDEIQEERLSDPNFQWEWTKYNIRAFCIRYSADKKRAQKQQVLNLEKRLYTLAEDHDLTSSPDIVEEVKSIKRELGEIAQTKASAAVFRTKAKWSSQGELPTAYYLGLEKRRSKNNTITTLLTSDGHTVADNKEILQMEKEFFEKIYTQDSQELDPLDQFPLKEGDVPVISRLNRSRMDRPFTAQEFLDALKDLNKGKTPGTDGITPEFYQTFWEQLKDEFLESIEHSLDIGSFTDQQRTGVITLVPKKDMDRRLLTNWRPITLLNTDIKILSKALAKRIQSCIREVVSEDQTGFIRTRSITSNLLTIQSIIDYTDETSTQSILLALDFSKAFDMVRWKLIEKALDLFGFGEYISSVVAALFKDIKTCTSNAGFSSDPFYPTRGIRQGCCASPVLFVLAVELLAILVRRTESIKGLEIAGRELKISQYADDATFFLRDSASLTSLRLTLDSFSKLSGLRMNTQKSHLLLLGNYKDPPSSIENIKVTDSVKILGMTYKTKMNGDEQYLLNFATRIKKIKQICESWSNRRMSLKGKVTLINSLLVSVLQYPCSCTFTPERVLVEFKRIVTDFLWDGKRSKIAYNLLIQQIEDGGLKLADLETRLHTIRLSLIQKVWNNPDSTWAALLAHSLCARNIKHVLLFKADLVSSQPTSYQTFAQLLKSWVKFHKFEPKTEGEVQTETLWNNRDIIISGNPISWDQWKNAGIWCINDLLHKEEPRFSSHLELSAEFNLKCTFLQVLQLRSAIPCKWKRLLLSSRKQDLILKPLIKAADGTVIQIPDVSAKRIYQAILPYKLPTVTSQGKWNQIYPVNQEDQKEHWKDVYTSPYKATRETKLQAFQYRVIHRTIPCNRYLHNIRIKQEDVCSFCNPPTSDTLQHFLFSCPKSADFWRSFCRWLATQANFHINLTEEEFLFGVPRGTPQARSINFLTILVKHFIFRQKLFHSANLDLTHFLRELKSKLGIERFICKQEKRPERFRHWEHVYKALG